MGVIIRWLKGIKQPSRLTCWAYSTDIPPVLSMPCSRCTQGMSWRRPATPLLCRGNQALAAGSETRRRSVDGRVCLRNSPRPCESRSHLSGSPSVNVGLVPPVWQWHLGGEVVCNKTPFHRVGRSSPRGTPSVVWSHRLPRARRTSVHRRAVFGVQGLDSSVG